MVEENMYDSTGNWGVFVGCKFNCAYCELSFQRQVKRWGKNNCQKCYNYEPHFHEERLKRIPSEEIVFVGGSSDIAFASTENLKKVIERIKEHNERCPYKTYYFQTKCPSTFDRFSYLLPDNCILVTTIETDKKKFMRGLRYIEFSEAPPPPERIRKMEALNYPRKVVTIEPVMEFSHLFDKKIKRIDPEYVWVGYNSKPESVELPEPNVSQLERLIEELDEYGIEVRGKTLRGANIPKREENDE